MNFAVFTLFAGAASALSMRNINGECVAEFCWNGQIVDPFDCWCPDPDSQPTGGQNGSGFGGGGNSSGGRNGGGSGSGSRGSGTGAGSNTGNQSNSGGRDGGSSSGGGTSTATAAPGCIQKKCWDNTTPNPIDCSCSLRPPKPKIDRGVNGQASGPRDKSDGVRARPIQTEFEIRSQADATWPFAQYFLLVTGGIYYEYNLSRHPEFVENLAKQSPARWPFSRMVNRYYWLSLLGIYAVQIIVDLDFLRIFLGWILLLTMPLALLAQLGLNFMMFYETLLVQDRYTIMKETMFTQMTIELLASLYAMHLSQFVVDYGQYKYWGGKEYTWQQKPIEEENKTEFADF